MPATIPPAAAPAAQIAVVSEDWAAADPRPPAPAPVAPKSTAAASAPGVIPAALVTDPRIKNAVAETIAAAPDQPSAAPNQQGAQRGAALRTDQYASFTRQFSHARVPDCFGSDALKFQPPRVGPVVLGGLLAIPFVVVAAARGKCN